MVKGGERDSKERECEPGISSILLGDHNIQYICTLNQAAKF